MGRAAIYEPNPGPRTTQRAHPLSLQKNKRRLAAAPVRTGHTHAGGRRTGQCVRAWYAVRQYVGMRARRWERTRPGRALRGVYVGTCGAPLHARLAGVAGGLPADACSRPWSGGHDARAWPLPNEHFTMNSPAYPPLRTVVQITAVSVQEQQARPVSTDDMHAFQCQTFTRHQTDTKWTISSKID